MWTDFIYILFKDEEAEEGDTGGVTFWTSGLLETWNAPDKLDEDILFLFLYWFLTFYNNTPGIFICSRDVLWTTKLHLTFHQHEGE